MTNDTNRPATISELYLLDLRGYSIADAFLKALKSGGDPDDVRLSYCALAEHLRAHYPDPDCVQGAMQGLDGEFGELDSCDDDRGSYGALGDMAEGMLHRTLKTSSFAVFWATDAIEYVFLGWALKVIDSYRSSSAPGIVLRQASEAMKEAQDELSGTRLGGLAEDRLRVCKSPWGGTGLGH